MSCIQHDRALLFLLLVVVPSNVLLVVEGRAHWVFADDWGRWATCPSDEVAIGFCASQDSKQCVGTMGEKYSHGILCELLERVLVVSTY